MTTENTKASVKKLFSPTIEYKGKGRAEFASPKGIAEGIVTVRFSENGKYSIHMDVESVKSEYHMFVGEAEFFSGRSSTPAGSGVVLTLDVASRNPCTKLEVSTEEGVFLIEEKHGEFNNINYGYSFGSKTSLDFFVSHSEFNTTNVGAAKYWVLPLTNFISEFVQQDPRITSHPLCLNSTTAKVIFEFDNELGFIQKLDGYDELTKKLLQKEEVIRVTSLMVGNVGSCLTNYCDLQNWFPFEFLALLGVATGSEIGCPWIDFYDDNGQLVKRTHVNTNLHYFIRGDAAITESVNLGTGLLLTRFSEFMSSTEYGNLPLLVVLRNIVRSGAYEQVTLEEKFVFVSRCFEGLAKYYGLSEQENLWKILTSNQQTNVDSVLKNAAKSIRSEARTAQNAGQTQEASYLERIAGRVTSSKGKDKYFGLSVVDLLTKFGLNDATILANHYSQNPRPDNSDWPGVLSKYRGAAIHESYFDVQQGGRHDGLDVFQITNHLHDILVRIVFKILKYDRTYQPILKGYKRYADIDLDWVKTTTAASELGYK